MSLAPFGEDEDRRYESPSLSDVVGYVMGMIERECERTENRANGGPLELRISVVEYASELLQVAEAGNPATMRKVLRGLRGAEPAGAQTLPAEQAPERPAGNNQPCT